MPLEIIHALSRDQKLCCMSLVFYEIDKHKVNLLKRHELIEYNILKCTGMYKMHTIMFYKTIFKTDLQK